MLIGMRGEFFLFFRFAASVVSSFVLIAMRGKIFFVLPVCGVGGKFFCADRDEVLIMDFTANAAIAKSAPSHAPHPYHANAFTSNAAKAKSAPSHAPHLYLANVSISHAAKAKSA